MEPWKRDSDTIAPGYWMVNYVHTLGKSNIESTWFFTIGREGIKAFELLDLLGKTESVPPNTVIIRNMVRVG